ncbi:diacylglycerol kinase family protein [Propioniciclava sp.]|uniref:diacylglycerol/lipid kinase family protein n=1 Tax=Propioniciclava sp. TaxID=2038686 RepID=UPI002635A6D4|nr:diacylglycerol kinase family protein [Propioniciclava sp.]
MAGHNDPFSDPEPTSPLWVILNPKSKDYVRARRAVLAGCETSGLPMPHIVTTTLDAAGGPQAREALAGGARTVIVGGGDGTVREVAGALAGSGVELGILPIGTANLFAHNLGLRTRVLRLAVRRALTPGGTPTDVAWASWRATDAAGAVAAPSREQPFLVMAGVGHDAATVDATDPKNKDRIGWLAYLTAGVARLRERPLDMRVSFDMTPARRIRTWTLIVANCGAIPAGVRVVATASPHDGVLDTLEVPLQSPTQWASVAAKGLLKHSREVGALRYGTARTVWAVPDHPTPLHLDGDVVGVVADLRVRIQAGALLVRQG